MVFIVVETLVVADVYSMKIFIGVASIITIVVRF
jgi:hypothetical protein